MLTHKGSPRFIVASVSGYRINPANPSRNTGRVEMSSYTVLDRAYCHEIVASFPATTRHMQTVAELRARATCDALNADEPVPVWDARRRRLVYQQAEL